ncbi:MAG: Ig-like domain-containing protein [bacterium]
MADSTSTTCPLLPRHKPLVPRPILLLAAALVAIRLGSTDLAAIEPWPGEAWNTASNLTSLGPGGGWWNSDLSGAYWNPATRRLWLANNSGVFTMLKENGAGGFTNARNYFVSGVSTQRDLEGITQASNTNLVYLLHERMNVIREYTVSSGATNQSWNLSSLVGLMPDPNDGTEGIAFIPDSWLAASGFRDGNGDLYPQSAYGANGLGGIMLVGVQHFTNALTTTGYVYAVDLHTNGTWKTVGRYKTASRGDSCDLSFDPSTGRLHILHNSVNSQPQTNTLEITDLTSTACGSDRQFTTLYEFKMPGTFSQNLEGFAVTPALTSSNTVGDKWCFITDDVGDDGALRWFRQLPYPVSCNAGNYQSAAPSTQVAVPPSVLVRDAFHTPLTNLAVTFSVTCGGGSVAGGTATSGPSGIATVGSWTLGTTPGSNTLAANGAGLSGGPVVFTAFVTDPAKTNTLVIAGPAYGRCSPGYGILTNHAWTVIQAAVTNSPVSAQGTQFVCTAASVTGNSFTQASPTNVMMALTSNATMTWRWATNCWVAALTNGEGTVSGACAWVSLGSNVTLQAFTSSYSYFAGWSGDVSGPGTGDVSYAVTMDRARTLVANFADQRTSNGTPWRWLAQHYPDTTDYDAAESSDSDGDRMMAREEYRAGTDPTNALSLLKMTAARCTTNLFIISWSSVTGHTYTLHGSTNLTGNWPAAALTSGVPADISGVTTVENASTSGTPAFIRVSIE